MNNKELQVELAQRLSMPKKDVETLMQSLTRKMTETFLSEKSVFISGIGTLEVKQNASRVSVLPQSKEKVIVPPKKSFSLKVTPSYKEKLKEKSHE